jgi:hypothetical protein
MKAFLLIALLPLAAEAQLAMYAVTGANSTSVGSSYQFGQVAINTTSSVQFQIFNTTSAPITITSVTLSGAGFTFEYPLIQMPFLLPPNTNVTQTLNVWVSLTPTSTATFNASLAVNSASGGISTILYGSGVMAPTLTSGSGCTSSVPFNWGNVTLGNATACTFTLQNLNPQAVIVASIVVNGLGFTGPYGVTFPLTLQPLQSASFSVNFTPPGANAYAGTLVIGTQSYGLSGTGQLASVTGQPGLLPTPSLQFDSASYSSAQQGVLMVTFPSASPVAATGYVNLSFTPSTAAVKDDSEIVFLANGARTIPWSVSPGATTALLNGQSSATFQTGTTEGTITFAFTTAAAMTGTAPEKQFTIAGAKVMIDSTSASKEVLGSLVITIAGADNTYSTGPMSFSFFDINGNPMNSAPPADFTSAFKSYYAMVSGSGSAFIAQVTFPVMGSVTNIGSVTVTLTNAAGVASTGSLTFQ